MNPDTALSSAGDAAPLDHPALAQALVTLARSLDRRASDDEELPSYLDLAVLVADVERQLEDLTRVLVHYARRYERTTWKEIADTFGISRPTVYKRYGEPSPNDPGGDDDEGTVA
jgi:CRP-like cAMP-binding protein